MPYGYWIGRLVHGREFDIRRYGSNNIGFTNVRRVLGWGVALPVLLLDLLKGWLPAFLALQMTHNDLVALICMMAASLGHVFSLYFRIKEGKFSGGKAVATACGGLLALAPMQPMLVGVVVGVFLVTLLLTGFLSLGSLLGALAFPVMTVWLGLGWAWTLASILLAGFIFYTHRRNIGRLLHGLEPKFWHKKSAGKYVTQGEELRVAFAIHPRDIDDLEQSPLAAILSHLYKKKVISKETLYKWLLRAPVIEAGEISNIYTDDGVRVRVLLYGVPLMPDQIENDDPSIRAVVRKRLQQVGELVHHRGMEMLGEGGLLSSADEAGTLLQKWLNEHKIPVTVTNGGAYTVAATLDAADEQVGEDGWDGKIVAIIGASGVINRMVARQIRKRTGVTMWGFARSDTSQIKDLREYDAVFTTERDLDRLRDADIVITATSAPGYVLTEKHRALLKPGVLLFDIAFPPDIADTIGLPVMRTGLIRLPGRPKCRLDIHFGERDGVPLMPACMAETILLAKTRRFDLATKLKIRDEALTFFSQEAKRAGFRVIFDSTSKASVFLGSGTR